MKKLAFGLALLSLLAGTSVYAKSETAKTLDALNEKARLDSKTLNVRMNIPGLFIGWTGGTVDFKLSPELTLGPIGKYFVYGSNTGFAAGLSMSYALNGQVFSSGWLVNPYAEYYQSNYNHRKENASAVIGTNLMYQWIWSNGINLQVGGGLVYSTLKLPMGVGGNDNIHPNADFTIGYAF